MNSARDAKNKGFYTYISQKRKPKLLLHRGVMRSVGVPVGLVLDAFSPFLSPHPSLLVSSKVFGRGALERAFVSH